jgi:hypothetical protein
MTPGVLLNRFNNIRHAQAKRWLIHTARGARVR